MSSNIFRIVFYNFTFLQHFPDVGCRNHSIWPKHEEEIAAGILFDIRQNPEVHIDTRESEIPNPIMKKLVDLVGKVINKD